MLDRLLVLCCLGLAVAAPLRAQTVPPEAAPSSASRAARARVEPGDRLYVKIWREPLLSDTLLVNERGEVALPKVGTVQVSGFTIGELQDTVRVRLARYLRDPSVEVIALRRVAVNGAVGKPNVYYVDVAASLRDVIARAGGVSETGDTKKVEIVRGAERIHVRDWERADSPGADLQSGDQVVVGRRSWWVLNAVQALGAVGVLASILVTLGRK